MTANASVQDQVPASATVNTAVVAPVVSSKVEEEVVVVAQPTAQDPMDEEGVISPTKKAKVLLNTQENKEQTSQNVLNQLKEFNNQIQLDEHSSMSNVLQVVGQLLETYQAQKKQIDLLKQENMNLKEQQQ